MEAQNQGGCEVEGLVLAARGTGGEDLLPEAEASHEDRVISQVGLDTVRAVGHQVQRRGGQGTSVVAAFLRLERGAIEEHGVLRLLGCGGQRDLEKALDDLAGGQVPGFQDGEGCLVRSEVHGLDFGRGHFAVDLSKWWCSVESSGIAWLVLLRWLLVVIIVVVFGHGELPHSVCT